MYEKDSFKKVVKKLLHNICFSFDRNGHCVSLECAMCEQQRMLCTTRSRQILSILKSIIWLKIDVEVEENGDKR
jgi:hypothetical protein